MEDRDNTLEVMEVIQREAQRACASGDIDPEDIAQDSLVKWLSLGRPTATPSYLRRMVARCASEARAKELKQNTHPVYTPNSVRRILESHPAPHFRRDISECLSSMRPAERDAITAAYTSGMPERGSKTERAFYRAIDNLAMRLNVHGIGSRRHAAGTAVSVSMIDRDYDGD